MFVYIILSSSQISIHSHVIFLLSCKVQNLPRALCFGGRVWSGWRWGRGGWGWRAPSSRRAARTRPRRAARWSARAAGSRPWPGRAPWPAPTAAACACARPRPSPACWGRSRPARAGTAERRPPARPWTCTGPRRRTPPTRPSPGTATSAPPSAFLKQHRKNWR